MAGIVVKGGLGWRRAPRGFSRSRALRSAFAGGDSLELLDRHPQGSPEADDRQALLTPAVFPLAGEEVGGGASDAQDRRSLLDGQEGGQTISGMRQVGRDSMKFHAPVGRSAPKKSPCSSTRPAVTASGRSGRAATLLFPAPRTVRNLSGDLHCDLPFDLPSGETTSRQASRATSHRHRDLPSDLPRDLSSEFSGASPTGTWGAVPAQDS